MKNLLRINMTRKSNSIRIFGAIMFCFLFVSAFRVDPLPETVSETSDSKMDVMEDRVHPLSRVAETMNHSAGSISIPWEMIDSETLCLARAIVSETKRPEEQLLVAWVIRNRVETGFRGKRTYQSVVLDPYQFSAFLSGTTDRSYYESLTHSSRVRGWNRALQIAHNIRHMNETYRPFSPETRHFYSERSMIDRSQPAWVEGELPLDITSVIDVDQNRFRFFEGIS